MTSMNTAKISSGFLSIPELSFTFIVTAVGRSLPIFAAIAVPHEIV